MASALLSTATREGLVLKVGALLVREWNGKLERVMILEKGFAWNGQTFGSLSRIAKAMTGTTWNGHRFFGLRQGKTLAADVGADCGNRGIPGSGDHRRVLLLQVFGIRRCRGAPGGQRST